MTQFSKYIILHSTTKYIAQFMDHLFKYNDIVRKVV